MRRRNLGPKVESERLILLRRSDGVQREYRLTSPVCIVKEPLLMRDGIGERRYHWNSRDLTVLGLPVYREIA